MWQDGSAEVKVSAAKQEALNQIHSPHNGNKELTPQAVLFLHVCTHVYTYAHTNKCKKKKKTLPSICNVLKWMYSSFITLVGAQ